jgi:hypothetical protein
MLNRQNPILCAVKEVLDQHKIEYTVSNGGKHIRVDYYYKGKRFRQTVAKSPSDWRAAKNVRSQVRNSINQMG